MTRKERLELNAMSKEAYGVSSRWQQLLDKPVFIPEVDAITKRKVKVAHYQALDDIKDEMEFLIAEKQEKLTKEVKT